MLSAFQPMQAMIALWPTAEFELPQEVTTLGESLRQQFPMFQEIQRVEPVSGGELPAELPRLVLLAEGRKWVLEIAPARVNLRRVCETPVPPRDLFNELQNCLVSLHAWLAERANLRVYRIGYVADFFCDTRASASEKIAHYFLQPRAVQGAIPNEAHVALHHRLVLGGGLMVNRWLRLQPMRTRDPRRLDFAAQVQVDLNTMAEDTQVKTGREIAHFLEQAQAHIEGGIPVLGDPDFLA